MNRLPFEFTTRVDFVGRVAQLDAIQEQIDRNGDTVIIRIVGDGGVGKTALLNEIRQRYNAQPGILVSEVIDFSQTAWRIKSWVMEKISHIHESGFKNYREKPYGTVFIADYNALAKERRIVLLFDTMELVYRTTLSKFILDLVQELDNTVFILAGRPSDEEEFKKELSKRFDPDKGDSNKVLELDLKGFTQEEVALYFDKVVTGVNIINDDLKQNIFLLSGGNPIKISLALDWLWRGIPFMPEITQWKPEELQTLLEAGAGDPENAELKRRREKFEQALMIGIDELGDTLTEAILYMAHIHKRFNYAMLAYFFPGDAEELLEQLRKLPFVKYISDDYFILHDEMTRLVQTYIWDLVEDPDLSLRRAISQRVCDYYKGALGKLGKVTGLDEQDKITYWSYKVEQMYYQLYADFDRGYQAFETLWEELVGDHRYELAALAIKFLREFEGTFEYSEILSCFVDGYYIGGGYITQQQFDEAEKVLQPGLEKLNKALTEFDPEKSPALDKYLKAQLYKVYNQLGFCYRSTGKWDKATENYQQSLELVFELVQESGVDSERKKPLMEQVAETLNNMANIKRLVGDLYKALLYCQTSVFIRKTWDPESLARSYYVLAIVYWELGGTAEAMRYLYDAEAICSPGDEVLLARIRAYRAYIFFHMGLPRRALAIFDEVEPVFRQREIFSELIQVLNLRSRIYRKYYALLTDELAGRDYIEVADACANEAFDKAKQIYDDFRLAECYLTMAFNCRLWAKADQEKVQAYHRQALQYWNQGFTLSEGRYYHLLALYNQLRGDIAFEAEEPEYRLAFDYYVDSCELATRFKHAVYERAIDKLGGRLRSLVIKEPEQVKGYIRRIISYWQRNPYLGVNYPELVDELNEIMNWIREQEDLEELQALYTAAIQKGNWRAAMGYCDSLLSVPGLYTDVDRASVILNKIRAARRLGDLWEARRLSKVVLQIGQELEEQSLVGRAHMMLAMVLWDTTSTAEATDHLEKAQVAFELDGNAMGLEQVKRFYNYILHRTGFFEEPYRELAEAAEFFNKARLNSDLSAVWNLMSRIARTAPEDSEVFSEVKAEQYARMALEKAELLQDSYRIAECHISLAMLESQRQRYEEVLNRIQNVLNHVLSPETHLLRSVCFEVQAEAYFNLKQWDVAFDACIQELVEATQSKPARMVRAVSFVYSALMQLPVGNVKKYAERIKSAWQSRGLENKFPMVIDICDQAIEYRPMC